MVIMTAKNNKTITIYTSLSIGEINPYELVIAMFPTGYFCNFTSIYYHELTDQIPKTIYVCNETISENRAKGEDALNNTKLRSAFIKPHRYTKYVFEFNNHKIVIVDRKKNSDHGVVEVSSKNILFPNNSRTTCRERALIDAIVSPQYNGGIVSVYSYFKNSLPKLNIHKLINIYKQLNYIYPYTQSIGFFLDRLGKQKLASIIYKAFPPNYKFFVDHNAKTSWMFDNKWKIYYPKGLVDEN